MLIICRGSASARLQWLTRRNKRLPCARLARQPGATSQPNELTLHCRLRAEQPGFDGAEATAYTPSTQAVWCVTVRCINSTLKAAQQQHQQQQPPPPPPPPSPAAPMTPIARCASRRMLRRAVESEPKQLTACRCSARSLSGLSSASTGCIDSCRAVAFDSMTAQHRVTRLCP